MAELTRRSFLEIGIAAAALGPAGCAAETGLSQASRSTGQHASGPPGSGRTHRPRPVPRRLQQAMRGPVITRGSPQFAAAAPVFNERFDGVRPWAVARPLDAQDAAAALGWAIARGVAFRARSGGHSYAGYSTLRDGLVIDLRHLRAIEVDRGSGTARIGAGAQLIDVITTLARHGATIPTGSCPSVGIGGSTLGGGFGLASRRFGLTADSLLGARIVTADGRIREVDARHDRDLFWALRGGGGGNFGLVTEFRFRLHRLPPVATYFNVSFPWSSADEAIDAWQRWAPHTADALTSILHIDAGPSINANGQYLGSAGGAQALLGPLLAVPGASLRALASADYVTTQLLLAGCAGIGEGACHTRGANAAGTLDRQSFTARSDYVRRPLSAAGRAAMLAAAEASGSGALLCDSYGGRVAQVHPHDTAFIHRDQLFCIQLYGDGASRGWVDQAWTRLRAHVSGQAYQNYIDRDLASWREAYYGANYRRLVEVKRAVDPDRRFHFPQAIGS